MVKMPFPNCIKLELVPLQPLPFFIRVDQNSSFFPFDTHFAFQLSRLIVLYWLLLLVLVSLKLVSRRMARPVSMPFCRTLWEWSSLLLLWTRWTQLSPSIMRGVLMKFKRKSVAMWRKLAITPKLWYLFPFLVSMVITCWNQAIMYVFSYWSLILKPFYP